VTPRARTAGPSVGEQLALELPIEDLAPVQVRIGRPRERTPALGAVEIADLLGRPAPTAEQVAVIEAPVEPLLVVAGAGSGKTETMAARVVWLVANGLVAPEQILGLTFTRKAAGELGDRIRLRLKTLHRLGLAGQHQPGQYQPGAVQLDAGADPQPVTVSTYHAYAAAILGDHGLRLGIEAGSRLLSEAGAWQLVDEIVERWDGDMSGVDAARASVVDAVLALAGECAEHLVGPGEVSDALQAVLDRVATLPAVVGDPAPGVPAAPIKKILARLAERQRIAAIAQAYLRVKREREVLDFGDQVALAARIAREVPEVGAGERERYRVVLLDEYQDTSHAQLMLLRELFGGGHPVTAVGDPHQSIYGWRGASAGNLQRFPEDFPPARVLHLATSWRNDRAVLHAANRVADPLRAPASWADPARHVPVPALAARPQVGPGAVRVSWLATVEDEAAAVAQVAEGAWHQGSSVAVLCRTRSQFPLVEAALRVRGLPVEVVGLGGLLHVPEVADLRAALEVLHDPSRGDSLMRLLTGAAWRLGPRDLDALGAWAGVLLRRVQRRAAGAAGAVDPEPVAPQSIEAGAGDASEVVELDTVDEKSLVEALDELPPVGWTGHAGQALSEPGRRRLTRLADVLRHLRTRAALALPDLVLEVERALLLDVEVASRPGRRPASARAHLDAFVDVAAAFAESGDRPTLGGFLGWLSAAESEERGLDVGVTEQRDDAVQVLTVHAAKGLEWDVVAVTGLVEGTFPTGHAGKAPSASNGWLTALGAVPFPIRGDAGGLPQWRVQAAASQAELATELEDFRAHCGAHEVAEERRLAYVAMTRARQRLLLTGATWGDGSTARTPSRFLAEVHELAEVAGSGASVGEWVEPPPDGAVNPRDSLTRSLAWPLDPLGERRAALEDAAELVRQTIADNTRAPLDDADPWARELEALLAEREALATARLEVQLPQHLSASQVVALAADPAGLAARLRRPMPEPPSPASRRGTAFHAWLERRFGLAALVDVDELPGAADDAAADDDLAALQAAFLASEWADRTPDQVEVSVETPVAGLAVRGRIDAVFRYPAAEGDRWDVVDWKTGAPPASAASARAVAVQLAVYRLAWARLTGVEVDRVGAAFFYAANGQTVRPVDLLDGAGLAALVERAVREPEPDPDPERDPGAEPRVRPAARRR